MAPFLTERQRCALAAFETAYASLPWRVIESHPHVSELPGDDLTPLVPAGQRLLDLIDPHRSGRVRPVVDKLIKAAKGLKKLIRSNTPKT